MATPEFEAEVWIAKCVADMDKVLDLTPLQIASVLSAMLERVINSARYQDPKEGMDK